MNKHIIFSSLIFLILLLITFNSFSYYKIYNKDYNKLSLILNEEECRLLSEYAKEITKLKYLNKSKDNVIKDLNIDINKDERYKGLLNIINYVYKKDLYNKDIEMNENSIYIFNECLNK